ncbi:MAG: DUF4013 domain-containing protein [Opitutales bacterium]|nr:DUF4013 domain-containing protein [Opitutales bacterium]
MPGFERIAAEIWKQPGFRRNWLIGGLIASVPVLNLLLFGYLYQYVQRIGEGKGPALQAWRFNRALLEATLTGVAAALIYLLLPVFVGLFLSFMLGSFFVWIGLPLLGATAAWLPATLALLFAVPLFLLSLVHLNEHEDMKSLLDWKEVIGELQSRGQSLWAPLMVFFGFMAIGWPLLGFVLYFAITPLTAVVAVRSARGASDSGLRS